MLVKTLQRIEEGGKQNNLFSLFQGVFNEFNGLSALSEGEFSACRGQPTDRLPDSASINQPEVAFADGSELL